MAQNQINVRMITRHDTEVNWNQKNPILMAGELGINDDNHLIKVGDDIHSWKDLPYINDPANSVAAHYEGTATLLDSGSYETDNEVITRVIGSNEVKAGDIFIVKRVIAGEKISYTAYVYEGSNWTAMDGNYNAENVYFDKDFTVTSDIGAIEIPNGQSNTTLAAQGKSVKEVLAAILATRKTPTATKPAVTVRLTGSTSVEVGTQITPSYTASLSAGSYTYGPATGITATSWSVTDNATTPNTLTTATGTFPAITVGDTTNYKVTATATYGNGAIPVDNLGEAYAEAQIKAGSASASTTTTLKGYRNYYYGVLSTSTEEAPITSDLIRSLTAGGAYNGKKTHTITAASVSGAKRIIVAYPASAVAGARTGLSAATITSSLNYDALGNGDYVKQANVSVEGINGYTAVPYIVYKYEPASLDSAEVHSITLA